MTNFDLHMHSNISNDGELTPEELIELAHKQGLRYVALSDHNDYRGIEKMQEAGKRYDIQVIPAIEFDTLFDIHEVHVLGYNIDYHHPYFTDLAKQVDDKILVGMAQRFEKFRQAYGVTLDEKEVYARTPKGENPFFTLVSMMLNDPANKDSPEFQDYLPGGRRSTPQVVNFYWDKCCVGTDNYVKVEYPDFKKTVDIIHETGGIAVLAHPWKTFYKREDLLEKAFAWGIDGIEAYSNYHEPKHNAYYEEIAKKYHVLMTCGSDFHGSKKPNIMMGEYGYHKDDGADILQTFLKKLGR